MSNFAKQNPVQSNLWWKFESLPLLSIALLMCKIDPGAPEKYLQAMSEPLTSEEMPDEYFLVIDLLEEAIFNKSLTPAVTILNAKGRCDINKTIIRIDDFFLWCKKKNILFSVLKLSAYRQSQPSIASDNKTLKESSERAPFEEPISESKILVKKERQSMLRIIIGMAVDAYRYDPLANQSPFTGEGEDSLYKALQLIGINVNSDTIRKYLKEAAEFLPNRS